MAMPPYNTVACIRSFVCIMVLLAAKMCVRYAAITLITLRSENKLYADDHLKMHFLKQIHVNIATAVLYVVLYK